MASDPMLLKWTEHPVKFPGGDNFIWREGDYYYLTYSAGVAKLPPWSSCAPKT